MSVDPWITEHGEQRLRERVGVPRKAVERLVRLVLARGRRPDEFQGKFRRWLDNVAWSRARPLNVRVHGDKVYIFDGATLITVLVVPASLRSAIMKGARSAVRTP